MSRDALITAILSATTPEEIAEAQRDARVHLAEEPEDWDVRIALEQLVTKEHIPAD